jgi:GNAT superfamily N-acetyltransferase
MTFEIKPYAVTDPEVAPLLTELAHEYYTRYGNSAEINRYPPEEFAPPWGALLILRENGASIAGGAFKRYDEQTAEVKRMWTHSSHRRRGLARLVLSELEDEAKRRGYRRLFLTTGSKQPEAAALYLATGYHSLDTSALNPEGYGLLAFEKDLQRPPKAACPAVRYPLFGVQAAGSRSATMDNRRKNLANNQPSGDTGLDD